MAKSRALVFSFFLFFRFFVFLFFVFCFLFFRFFRFFTFFFQDIDSDRVLARSRFESIFGLVISHARFAPQPHPAEAFVPRHSAAAAAAAVLWARAC